MKSEVSTEDSHFAALEITLYNEPRGSLPCSHRLAISTYPQPVQPNPVFNPVFLRSIPTQSSQIGPQNHNQSTL